MHKFNGPSATTFVPQMAVLGVLSGSLLAPVQAQSATGTAAVTVPQANLRAYGKIQASWRPLDAGKRSSVLQVSAQSVAKAQLILAKYLSDLSSLPGVISSTVTTVAGPVQIQQVAGQGGIAALRNGMQVFIFAAPNQAALVEAIGREKAQLGAKPVSKAEVPVPMWLDRWDKNSFRFYYREWELPEGVKKQDYNYPAEFDFAKEQQNAGFVFWAPNLYVDGAEAITNDNHWDWGFEEAKKRNLPVGINDSAGSNFTGWLLNRYRDQTQGEMPGYIGTYYSPLNTGNGQQGLLSWNATDGLDAELGVLQQTIKRFAAEPNVTSFLEPHGEVRHGMHDLLMEYGPTADAAYRRYLQNRYKIVQKVNERWGTSYKSWDEIRVPELVEFAGGGAESLDLKGTWKFGFEPFKDAANPAAGTNPAPTEWAGENFDDATWPSIEAPGDELAMFLPRRPAIFRRTIEVPAAYRQKHQRFWVYLWDMHKTKGEQMPLWVNGHEVTRDIVKFNFPHWFAVEVTQDLKPGRNVIAVRLPLGAMAYRAYLSPEEPKTYPNLGEKKNAQWVDFFDFHQSSRYETVRRGMEMIRQVDPDRQITMMSPDGFADGILQNAQDYGGQFHNTGYMSAFYSDYLPNLMRGAGLPMSLEPGGPAGTIDEFKKMLGLYQTEGLQGIDYFIHVGNIMWKPDIKEYFAKVRNQLALLGKYNFPRAEVATFQSDRVSGLMGWPWDVGSTSNLRSGYWNWNAGAFLRESFPYDGLAPSSFKRGDAAKYKVIIDSSTSILDEAQVTEIEDYVKNGGVFITFGQTGRHTPEKADSWPISRLTGYSVQKIDALRETGDVNEKGLLTPAPGQTILGPQWKNAIANGLHLRREAADAVDLLLWQDGTVAAGYRPLGKGIIVNLGMKFTGAGMQDRVEPGGNSSEIVACRSLFGSILDWRGIKREPAKLAKPNEKILVRHAVTNNGLFDVWTLWNQTKDAQTVTLNFDAGIRPASATEVRDGKEIPLSADKSSIPDIALEGLDTRVFLTPRGQLDKAPLDWLKLQTNWWQGTKQPENRKLPTTQEMQKWTRDLTDGWQVKYLDAEDSAPLMAVGVDDKAWPKRKIGIWNPADVGGKTRAVFRRNFTVPAEWKNGVAAFWISSWNSTTFIDGGKVFMDGEQVWPQDKNRPFLADGPRGLELTSLKPGTTHTLAVEMTGKGYILGLRGSAWINFIPEPDAAQDLGGTYEPSKDAMAWGTSIQLPGKFDGQFLRRKVTIDGTQRSKTAVVMVDGDRALAGVFINGRFIRRHHHLIGERWTLNITPYIKWGEENEFALFTAGSGTLRSVRLGFYKPGYYP